MSQDYQENVKTLIRYLGGTGNIVSITNCMTRLRTVVKDPAAVEEDNIRSQEDVMGLVHDRANYVEIVVGPGRSRKYADLCHEMGLAASSGEPAQTAADKEDWKTFKDEVRAHQKTSRIKSALKVVGDIFVPLIPGVITAGLCAGFASLIAQVVPDYADNKVWSIIWQFLALIQASFMSYLTAWAGYRAAERFGATPILGGMLGMITSLDGINQISMLLGLYDEGNPLNSVLRTGKGGVLAVIIGVFLLAIVEKAVRKRMPESIDVIFTPLLSLLVCVIPYVLIIMPLLGYVSSGIVWVFSKLCMSQSLVVRIIAGYVSTALFLPLVAAGMHHGFVALYSVQLQELGYVTLYPALAMAGAGQVGTAIALWLKAKSVGNRRLCSVISGALPAGFLGIGEPLIYGVTLPLGKPFITAGLGAGFGGALVMAYEVAATTWGPSGLLAVFVMTAGPHGAINSVFTYLAGLIVAYICSFIITSLVYDKRELMPEDSRPGQVGESDGLDDPAKAGRVSFPGDLAKFGRGDFPGDAAEAVRTAVPGNSPKVGAKAAYSMENTLSEEHRTVRHGDAIFLGETNASFEYTITDPSGIHARPAGQLAQLIRGFDCEVTASANGKSARAGSMTGLMQLGIAQGDTLTVTATGKDAKMAVEAVKVFLRESL